MPLLTPNSWLRGRSCSCVGCKSWLGELSLVPFLFALFGRTKHTSTEVLDMGRANDWSSKLAAGSDRAYSFFFFWRSLHSFVFFSRRHGDESIVKDFSLESVHSHTATQQGHQERARGGYTHLKQPVSATPGILSTTKVGEFEVVGPYTSPQTAACIGMGDWSLLRVLRLSRSPPIAKGKADD